MFSRRLRVMGRGALLAVAAFVGLSASAARAQNEGRERDRRAAAAPTHRDLEYARPDGRPQLLDLYLPKTEGPHPLVVWIHGGAWLHGNKRGGPARFLVGHGFAVASINYRLSQVAKYPAQIKDCKAAVVWLKTNAKQYRIDPNRVGVWGSSAGGHLAALVGVSAGVESLTPKTELAGKVDSRVQAVCDFFGPTDFLQMDAHAKPGAPIVHDDPKSPESQLIDGPIQEHPDRVRQANPVTFVSSDDPPFLIMHGDRDPLVPLHQSKLLHEALNAKKVPNEFKVVEGAGHGFRGPAVQERVLAFFTRHLKSQESEPTQKAPKNKKETPAEQPEKTTQAEREFNPRTVIGRHFKPIVDAPTVSAADVTDEVGDNDLVLGLVLGDQARAYPINMLCGPTREIINDTLGNRAIAATW